MAPQPTGNAGGAGISGVFSRVQNFSEMPDVQADYARYLCVLITGYLEQTIVQIIVDYVDALGNKSLHQYVAETLRRPGNMRAKQILDLVGRFSDAWQSHLHHKLTQRHRDAIGSLYASRNRIAHGDDVDLTYRQVQEYYKLILEAIRFVEEVVV